MYKHLLLVLSLSLAGFNIVSINKGLTQAEINALVAPKLGDASLSELQELKEFLQSSPGWLKHIGLCLGKDKTTALMLAATTGNTRIMHLLIGYGANVNARSTTGMTPLLYAAGWGRKAATLMLIKAGADINYQSWQKNTPLIEAVQNGYSDVVEVLLAAGACPNVQNITGDTPLTYAALRGDVKMVKLLLQYSGCTSLRNNRHESALDIAQNRIFMKDSYKEISLLLASFDQTGLGKL